MTAILFGSISTVADTSELQREAFNQAFADHGLGWTWDRDEYTAMLDRSGGADRISAYAAERGEQVDAEAVHATKSRRFQESLATADVTPRPGVTETVRAARADGLKVALVTTTSRANIDALLESLAPALTEDDFDLVVDRSDVDDPKPDPSAYALALSRLGEQAGSCVAIEDNVEGAVAASAAGVTCVAFPNANTDGQEFTTAERRVDTIDYADLKALADRT
ncbi:HAD-IA family hydrolase [Jatrophihabitans sp. YIM 134969]